MAGSKHASEERSYRWKCPLCGLWGIGATRTRAVTNLRRHLRSTTDCDHGYAQLVPAEIGTDTLGEYVAQVR